MLCVATTTNPVLPRHAWEGAAATTRRVAAPPLHSGFATPRGPSSPPVIGALCFSQPARSQVPQGTTAEMLLATCRLRDGPAAG